MIWWDYIILGLFFVILAYVSSRFASIGYFRTKLEFMRSVMKLTGESNDKE